MHAVWRQAARFVGTSWLCVALAPTASEAQTPRDSSASQAGGGVRWEVEGYGGASFGRTGSGTPAAPSPGPPLLTSSPTFPTRRTPSWFFGDGAALLNGVNEAFDVPERITPLDSAFAPLATGPGGTLGVRVRRAITSRLSLEFGVDAMLGSHGETDRLRRAVEATRDSFTAAFAGLLEAGPFVRGAVDTASSVRSTVRRDVAVTGAIHLRLGQGRAWSPYATFGAGVLTGGGLPSATLEGHYQFLALGVVPIEETDRVTLRYTRGAGVVGVVGAGLRREMGAAWGFSVDARVLLGPDTTRLLLDASPSSTPGAPSGFIQSATNPAIQFSNDPATGRESTLSGSPLRGFAAFTGGGLETRVLVTLGWYRRF